jgi:protein-tyrosine phosphatase
MRRGLIHFLASDGHDCQHRPPLLREAWDYAAKRHGERWAQFLLEEGPRCVLTGEDVPFMEIEVKPKSWLSFFRS